MFKLNKLHAQQSASSSNSLSTSPQPSLLLSGSPNSQLPPRLRNGHGHSMSLAQPSTLQPSFYNPSASFNPFGPDATLGSDQIAPRPRSSEPGPIHAPQGRVPVPIATLAPPPAASRPESRPDFARGFGLDIPEEEEEVEEVVEREVKEEEAEVADDVDTTVEASVEDSGEMELEELGSLTAPVSRLHSRHVSRLSAALSLRSVGGHMDEPIYEGPGLVPLLSPVGNPIIEDLDHSDHDHEAVQEWTGSEDLRDGDKSDDEVSLGEFSNPSDEERARHERQQRRLIRRSNRDLEAPRRLPNFPRPPESGPTFVDQFEDDLLSNPSDEHHSPEANYLVVEPNDFYPRPSSSSSGRVSRPLPPLPHSRTTSGQFTFHDPALAHSRRTSEQLHLGSQLTMPALNPNAKPFVFGASRLSGSFTPVLEPPPPAPGPAALTHVRAPSLGKPLNAAAVEFKPTFTFRPPEGVPQFSFPFAEVHRPLPVPPAQPSPVRAQQGREKRQRRSSVDDLEDDEDEEEGNTSMASFKFPPVADVPQHIRRSAPTTPPGAPRSSSADAASKPFTFSGFPALPAYVPDETDSESHLHRMESSVFEDIPADITTRAVHGSPSSGVRELPVPPTFKPKRAPIPLDFKHPVSTNTVPAGLFKALVNSATEERTRRGVRSRLSSREIFDHVPRPSLDDTNVTSIARKVSRSRLVSNPVRPEGSLSDSESVRIHRPRRSSLPALHSAENSSISGISLPPISTITKPDEAQSLEERFESILDEKMEVLRRDLLEYRHSAGDQGVNASMEAMMTEVVSLFRAQLQESAARGLEDSQMDARGELDFQVIKDIIDQGHADARVIIQRDLAQIVEHIQSHLRDSPGHLSDATSLMEELSNRMVNTVVGAVSQLAARLESIGNLRSTPSVDREAIVHDMLAVLSPHLAALRPEPVDYDNLTARLTQAVKPHISQLIDLASDKRETAGLIVERLLPILPSLSSTAPELDTDALVSQMAAEMRRIVSPIDTHEIKEQVSDLVVERLDARLSVRDRAFNVDNIATRISENIAQTLEPLREALKTLGSFPQGQQLLSAQNQDLLAKHNDLVAITSSLPSQFAATTEGLQAAQSNLRNEILRLPTDESLAKALQPILSGMEGLIDDQKSFAVLSGELSEVRQDFTTRLDALPQILSAPTKALHDSFAEFASRAVSKQDLEEMRRLMTTNAELQVQLAKARGAHGQVRVEKDNLIEEMRTIDAANEAHSKSVETRASELEEALSQALDRLKASDVATQSHQEHINALEKSNRDLATEKERLKTKIDALELKSALALRDAEVVSQSLSQLRKEHEELRSQQSHWDDLRRASEQIENLTLLVSRADNEEVTELKRIRDRSKLMEGEYAALQKRYKEQESKPQGSVWDSMHAPRSYQTPRSSTPKTKPPYYRPSVPSPTPSTVSLAPTLGNDGWWE
ncbi:hypothetical protein JAAARDRAFT_356270 [Jaapia argillacea MUCL 33604]|uniref:Uncharacterized protein n=1 Tax=Jaapia argillacea MUCL 33604 TaxID=933084 RepID=A0A067PJB2_9AGAM|nr:hypothetical protein JAAARDRAFT_356270 [Jaapia argillacea MUCL 33604]